MKRKEFRLALTLLACVLLSVLFAIPAMAENDKNKNKEKEEVKVEVQAEPAELSESGMVLLTFEISNYSDFELHEITIGLDNAIFQVDGMEGCIIPPGGSVTFSLQYEVPDSKIGLEQLFQVSWLKYGEPFTMEVPVTIARAVEPVIAIKRTVSSEYAKQGDTITLTYELSNDTKFDMTNITVIDEQISDNPIFRNHTLNAGGKITQSYVYTMGDSDAVSAPTVAYDVNGKTKTFSAIDPITLSMVQIEIDLKVEMGTPTAAGVPFTITVNNTGNQSVTDIRITDELSNPIHGDTFSLNPGENRTISYLVVPISTEPVRNVSFRLTGTDAFGADYSPVFDTVYEVHPFVDDSQIDVVLLTEILEPWTAQTGAVRARVTMRNNSAVELTNAVLSEATLGELKTYELLPAGDTVYEDELIIGSPRNLTFSLKATDPAGTERLLTGAMLTVAYPTATATPEPTTLPTAEPIGTVGNWNRTLVTVLLIVGGIMLTAFVALIVLAVLEHKKTGGLLLDDDEPEELEIDESIDEAFMEDAPEPQRLSAPRGPSDYVRIAEERRQHYVPVKRPLIPPIVPEFDDGTPEDAGMPQTDALDQAALNPTAAPENRPYEKRRTNVEAHQSPEPSIPMNGQAAMAQQQPPQENIAFWLQADDEQSGNSHTGMPKHMSIHKEPAVLPKKKQEIHRVQAADGEKTK